MAALGMQANVAFGPPLFGITSAAAVRQAEGIRLDRFAATIANVPEFRAVQEEVVAYWRLRPGIPYSGRGDVGRDVDNKSWYAAKPAA